MSTEKRGRILWTGFIELVVTPLSIFRLLLVGWVGPAEAGYEVSLGSGNTCALDYADV